MHDVARMKGMIVYTYVHMLLINDNDDKLLIYPRASLMYDDDYDESSE